ncbi:MAG: hypothetical protein GQ574_20590 [Crocinitomix sp.]|nr:hypothetical protein [Crocinitomix sp.]
MLQFADNNNNTVLDQRLCEYLRAKVDPNFIVYNQFLKQLHLPAEKWEYDKKHKGKILIEQEAELEELDALLFKNLDYSKLATPLWIYKYNLLQLLLGNGLNYQGIGMIRERKIRFLFVGTEFNLENRLNVQFEENDLSRFILRRAKKQEILTAHESFFVLINEKFKAKLLNALMLYQSETGNTLSKSHLIESLLNVERLSALQQFSAKLINRL